MPQKILPLALVGLALASLTIGCHSSPPVAEPSLQKPNLEERMAASRARTPNDPGFFATPHDEPREKPSDRFPNTELVASDGKTYRFYEDLVRDRIVVIQFMYTTCTGI